MKFKVLLALIGIALSQTAFAINNDGYTKITQMNSWATENDIYLEESHTCEGVGKTLYKLPKLDNQQYSLLLAAFSAGFKVRLNYHCASNGYLEINAVRVKK